MPREPFYGVVDPRTRTVYVNDPTNIMGVGALLDHLLAEERFRDADTMLDDRHSVPDAEESSLDKPGRW
jgi:hypothetical protein